MASDVAQRGSYLICRVGACLCGLPLEHVVETMRPLPLDPLAGAPAFVSGVSLIRGRPVPIVDAGLLLGVEQASPSRLISIKAGGGVVALAVEGVLGVRFIPDDALDELPPLLDGAGGDVIDALGMLDSALLVLLQHGHLVPESVWTLVEGQESS
jgi:purine-binding chemotaxis protein CheW